MSIPLDSQDLAILDVVQRWSGGTDSTINQILGEIRRVYKRTTHAEDPEVALKRTFLLQRQSLPLSAKVAMSKRRIQEWYDHWEGLVYVAFSGGKDSVVLLDLVRSEFPEVPAVFVNTGLEWPEIRSFVETVDNVTTLRPKMSFTTVLETFGFPVVSKMVARFIRDMRKPEHVNRKTQKLRLTGITSTGNYCPSMRLPGKWRSLVDAPFKISEQCCDVMKKEPFLRYSKETGRKPISGILAADSRGRTNEYIRSGCNIYKGRRAISRPMSFWLSEDVLRYIQEHGLPYSPIYGELDEAADGTLCFSGERNTGCIFCAFGAHLEKPTNRFQRMKKTHPKLWEYCMDKLGLREVLTFVGIPIE